MPFGDPIKTSLLITAVQMYCNTFILIVTSPSALHQWSRVPTQTLPWLCSAEHNHGSVRSSSSLLKCLQSGSSLKRYSSRLLNAACENTPPYHILNAFSTTPQSLPLSLCYVNLYNALPRHAFVATSQARATSHPTALSLIPSSYAVST